MHKKSEQIKGFVKELIPSLEAPFRETKVSPEESPVIEKKLKEIESQEKFARATYRFIEASGLAEFKQRLEKKLEETQMERNNFYYSKLIEGIMLFKKIPLAKAIAGYLRNVIFDYFAEQHKQRSEVEIGSPLDQEIPLREEVLQDYLSFVPYWIANAIFLYNEFGERSVQDITKMITDMGGFYAEAGAVFRKAQTTFRRGGEVGAALSFMRLIDKNKNLFPSLHVEVVANAYSKMAKIIHTYASDRETDYSKVISRIKDRAIKILEACLLTKQHSLLDISAGLAAVSARDSGFTKEQAEFFINSMFKRDSYGMSANVVNRIRAEMKATYGYLMDKIETDPEKNYTEILIGYIQSIEKETKITQKYDSFSESKKSIRTA